MNSFPVLEKILDSKDFTVGGGSASALAGAMASSLVAMVARLSLGKGYGLPDEHYLLVAEEAEKLSQSLLNGAAEDEEAYAEIKKAYCLPKETPDQQELRAQYIELALLEAARVPGENGLRCTRAAELAEALLNKSNPRASSDLEIGRLLAGVAVIGCALNVAANAASVKNSNQAQELQREADRLVDFGFDCCKKGK